MSYNTLKLALPSVNESLRKYFDSDDPIFRGFKIGGLRRNGGPRGGKRTPTWAVNDKALHKILLRSFPRMNALAPCCYAFATTDKGENGIRCRCPYHQRQAAGRWSVIAYMFWRLGKTQGEIVCALNQVEVGHEDDPPRWNLSKVKHVLQHIRSAAKGLRSDGSGKLTGRRPGRPRRVRDCSK